MAHGEKQLRMTAQTVPSGVPRSLAKRTTAEAAHSRSIIFIFISLHTLRQESLLSVPVSPFILQTTFNQLAGDPCPGEAKTLAVIYLLNGKRYTKTAREGEEITIS